MIKGFFCQWTCNEQDKFNNDNNNKDIQVNGFKITVDYYIQKIHLKRFIIIIIIETQYKV